MCEPQPGRAVKMFAERLTAARFLPFCQATHALVRVVLGHCYASDSILVKFTVNSRREAWTYPHVESIACWD